MGKRELSKDPKAVKRREAKAAAKAAKTDKAETPKDAPSHGFATTRESTGMGR